LLGEETSLRRDDDDTDDEGLLLLLLLLLSPRSLRLVSLLSFFVAERLRRSPLSSLVRCGC
jgi:hypothetical protein